MNHDQIAELLGAYALDAVDADEAATVEAHLATCARCRAEVADHREVAALLSHSGADAPEGLWDRISGSLEAAPPRLDLAPVHDLGLAAQERRRRRLPSAATVVLSAAAALLIVFLGVQVRDQDHRIDTLQSALADPMTPAFEAAFDDPDSRRFSLTSADGEIVVLGAVTDDGVGFLRANPLPDLGTGRTYQLWGAAGDELVSLGVLGDRPTVVSFRGDRYEAFAITEEVGAGVVQSKNDPVVAGTYV
jgi:predicted anti-sigma-YlaC factor YlaD